MKTFAPALMAVFHAHFDELVSDCLRRALADNTVGKHQYTEAEYRQLISGFLGMIEDAAYERPQETFQLLVDQIIPALVRDGTDPTAQLERTCAVSVRLGTLAGRELPADVSREASPWLADVLATFVSRAAQAAYATARIRDAGR